MTENTKSDIQPLLITSASECAFVGFIAWAAIGFSFVESTPFDSFDLTPFGKQVVHIATCVGCAMAMVMRSLSASLLLFVDFSIPKHSVILRGSGKPIFVGAFVCHSEFHLRCLLAVVILRDLNCLSNSQQKPIPRRVFRRSPSWLQIHAAFAMLWGCMRRCETRQ